MYVCKCPVPTQCNSPHDTIMTSMRPLKRSFPVLNSNTSCQPKHKCLKIGSQQNQPMSAHHLLSLKSQSSSPWLKHQWQPTKNMLCMFGICWCIDDLLHPFLTLNLELSFRLDFWTSGSQAPDSMKLVDPHVLITFFMTLHNMISIATTLELRSFSMDTICRDSGFDMLLVSLKDLKSLELWFNDLWYILLSSVQRMTF